MGDLFNNAMVNNALKALTPEQLNDYKKLGEDMYGNVNFEDSKIINSMPGPMAESVAYIEEGLRSGLLPSDLDENEVALLTSAFGEKWYLRYDFTEDEVPENGLSMAMKKGLDDLVEKKMAMEQAKVEKKAKKASDRKERRK